MGCRALGCVTCYAHATAPCVVEGKHQYEDHKLPLEVVLHQYDERIQHGTFIHLKIDQKAPFLMYIGAVLQAAINSILTLRYSLNLGVFILSLSRCSGCP